MIDTLLAAQLRSECEVSELSRRMIHLRDGNGTHEVDILIGASPRGRAQPSNLQ
jgi:hypothetical protein